MHSADYAVARCLSVRPFVGIVSKRHQRLEISVLDLISIK